MLKKRNIYNTAVETFEISCFLFPVEKGDAESGSKKEVLAENVRSVVSFNGAAEGRVVISPSQALLDAMAANMLGIEDPKQAQKEEDLCEVANIITGNIAPSVSNKDEICYIEPPKLREASDTIVLEQRMTKESVRIYLDAEQADIEVYYQTEEEQ